MSIVRIGVDVSQGELDVAISPSREEAVYIGDFKNSFEGFEALVEGLQKHCSHLESVEVVVEPTGGYEQVFAHWAHSMGWRITMPNPKQVRDWIKGMGQRAKTDKIDAQMLARYSWAKRLPSWAPLSEQWSRLDRLLDHRRQLKKSIRQEENRLHSLTSQGTTKDPVVSAHKRILKMFKDELKRNQKECDKLLKKNVEMREHAKRLLKCPGVGDATLLPLMVFLARWFALTNGQGGAKGLVAMAGLDPQPNRSGRRDLKKGIISKKGDKEMRAALFCAAKGGIRSKPDKPLRMFYDRLIGRNKCHNEGVVACARKILVWSWAVFREQKNFDPKMATSR